MKLGVAVYLSTDNQGADVQMEALQATGCERVFKEEVIGATADRPKLSHVIERLQQGDMLVVWQLERLGRSLRDVLAVYNMIRKRGASLFSVSEAIDTSNNQGQQLMKTLEGFVKFEREMIRERTVKGIERARNTGRQIGRKPKLNLDQKTEIVRMIEENRGNASHAASLFNVSYATVKRILQQQRKTRVT